MRACPAVVSFGAAALSLALLGAAIIDEAADAPEMPELRPTVSETSPTPTAATTESPSPMPSPSATSASPSPAPSTATLEPAQTTRSAPQPARTERTSRTGTRAPLTPSGTPRQLGQAAAQAKGWGDAQWKCLDALWSRESGWNPRAKNPSSTAYGIAQFLDSTWASTGMAKTSDPARQIEAGLIYINRRYGTPCAAWAFWQKRSWY
ncbi:transglycosylase SLT domain-containing protein [Kitasatospora sp. NPDC048540]|uniref:lytic transglycosylase domain-containing protein n=1 Tax=Kitasatospora sp. NPDC048540 TaxID=3155634 RepID=UPI0033BFFC88